MCLFATEHVLHIFAKIEVRHLLGTSNSSHPIRSVIVAILQFSAIAFSWSVIPIKSNHLFSQANTKALTK